MKQIATANYIEKHKRESLFKKTGSLPQVDKKQHLLAPRMNNFVSEQVRVEKSADMSAPRTDDEDDDTDSLDDGIPNELTERVAKMNI